MNRHPDLAFCAAVLMLLVLANCARKDGQGAAAKAAVSVQDDKQKCVNEPRMDENNKRPRCGGISAAAPARHGYRFVGGGGDPIDQVVCDIGKPFVLNGKMFGNALSGGLNGTTRLVRQPNIPGLHWRSSGRYHIDFPDGPGKPGTMTVEAGGTTTAGSLSRDTSGGEHFTLTPVAECRP